MIIDGRSLALQIKKKLRKEVEALLHIDIHPKIGIVTFKTFETTWRAYIKQKILLAEELGVEYEHIMLVDDDEEKLLTIIEGLNENKSIQGFIVQRPFPTNINTLKIVETVSKHKDIDGFRVDSPFSPPIWLAVEAILQYVARTEHVARVYEWLHDKEVVVIGRGESAGDPIIKSLKKHQIDPIVIYSQGNNRRGSDSNELLKKADVIISAVGKRVVSGQNLKNGVVLISVGLTRNDAGKLQGDYDEEEIKNIASCYTPTPGGVGPLNVAYLFKNLLQAARG